MFLPTTWWDMFYQHVKDMFIPPTTWWNNGTCSTTNNHPPSPPPKNTQQQQQKTNKQTLCSQSTCVSKINHIYTARCGLMYKTKQKMIPRLKTTTTWTQHLSHKLWRTEPFHQCSHWSQHNDMPAITQRLCQQNHKGTLPKPQPYVSKNIHKGILAKTQTYISKQHILAKIQMYVSKQIHTKVRHSKTQNYQWKRQQKRNNEKGTSVSIIQRIKCWAKPVN